MSVLLLLLSYTSAQPTYCVSGPTYTSDTNLGPVSLKGDSSTITDSFDCPKVIGPRNLTNLTADLTTDGLYNLVFSITACGVVYGSTVGAWIDYNNNGVFETNENLFFRSYVGTAFNTSVPFVVQHNGTYYGSTRLRVQVQETSSTQIIPCATFSFGGTKDFTVVIKRASPYCTSGPTSEEDTQLGPLMLQGEKRDLVQYAEPCPGYLGPTNFSDIVADVVPGRSYPLALSVVSCRKQYIQVTSIWIDWNGDFIWTENERVLQPTTKFGAIMHTISVPSDAKIGTTAMRVMVQETSNPSIGPCDDFKYGATQDYVINVMASRV